jgi:uncharacterized circularly permuted ATP-grasp superfamily protein
LGIMPSGRTAVAAAPKRTMWWDSYDSPGCWDELVADRHPRYACDGVVRFLGLLGKELAGRQAAADLAVRSMGITFTVYSEAANIDQPWPFDVIPRVISTQEWERISRGLIQRLTALNLFINDLYGAAKVVSDGVLPAEVLASSINYLPQCQGVRPQGGVWAHICGSDLVRDADGTMYVLEDNLRVPSGVSYMLENRQLTKQVFADLFRDLDIHPVDGYPNKLASFLGDLSPRAGAAPVIAVLTPGIFNSAYFEHAFLAQQMGAHLVEGHDLVVESDDCVYMRTIGGLVRVDVIYRRVDDVFLDPEVFRSDSMVGVHGLMRAWRAGKVAIANAPGTGVADDKVIYSYVPALVRYYLGEDPMIPIVPTWLCHDDKERSHVLSHLEEMVVKPANGSGGNGVFVGSMSTKAARDEMRLRVQANPRSYIAQPIVRLSTAPTLSSGRIVPRHLDLRPFILSGEHPYVTAGGLTRVALKEGSLVVNSSQGGGSKDTWVIDATVLPPRGQAQDQWQL